MQGIKHTGEVTSLKPRSDVTRSPNQWPHKKKMYTPKTFTKGYVDLEAFISFLVFAGILTPSSF